ncbi:MAG: arsenate reductase ArsC [Bacteroidota bacterium]|nr:arsenate reductase ArsC [Bacteroidota bacterium]
MKKILVLCTGNSCRSQIAHGFLNHYSNKSVEIYSAGIETHVVNPKAIETLAEIGIDISQHTSNLIDEYIDLSFDYLITVCDNAAENCPVFPLGEAVRIHQNFSDPSKKIGGEETVKKEFRKTREEINAFCKDFISKNLAH